MISTIITLQLGTEKRPSYYLLIDSLCYETETEDIYRELWEDRNLFDNSDYPKDSPFYSSENEKGIGKIKDEAGGLPISEFIGLWSKTTVRMRRRLRVSENMSSKRISLVRIIKIAY